MNKTQKPNNRNIGMLLIFIYKSLINEYKFNFINYEYR